MGLATEATFGTPVASTSYLPFTDNSMDTEPGVFYPEVMQATRAKEIYALLGQQVNTGSLGAPLFPTNGIQLLKAAVGSDTVVGSGITGTTLSGLTGTLTSGISAGATTLSYTTGGAKPSVGQFFQIDVNGATTSAEVVKLTSVVGTTSPYTLGFVATTFAHLISAVVVQVQAPFIHKLVVTNTLESLTIEKNIGNSQSLQYAGSRVGKYALKCQATNTAAEFTADITSQSVAEIACTAVSVVNESPFVFYQGTLTVGGNTVGQVINVELDIDNGLKSTFTQNSLHTVSYITPLTVSVTGSFDVVFDNLTTGNWDWFTQMINGTQSTLQYELLNTTTSEYINVFCDQINITKAPEEIKMTDVVMENVTFTASLYIGTTAGGQTNNELFYVTVANNNWLPF